MFRIRDAPWLSSFIDFEKAFNILETQYIWEELIRRELDNCYIEVLNNIFREAGVFYCLGININGRKINSFDWKKYGSPNYATINYRKKGGR